MSSTNVMEVITRGSFEAVVVDGNGDNRPPSSQPSATSSTKTENQLSLEYLPPEEPHYGGFLQPDQSPSEEGDETASELYSRIQALSEKIQSGLQVLKSPESMTKTVLATADSKDNDDDGSCTQQTPSFKLECSGHPSHEATSSADPNMDVKLQKAIEKMKKLDAKLADLTKKEKEVKKQRLVLEQQMEGGDNIQLSLKDCEDDLSVASPVFPTQLDERYSREDRALHVAGEHSETNHPDEGSVVGESLGKARPNHQEMQGRTDFIKRNIELASEAGTLVAMTEAEKKRLEELLVDDQVEDPYTSALPIGLPSSTSGFSYDEQEWDRIRDIDSQLQALMPPEEWESVCSTSHTTTPDLKTMVEPEDATKPITLETIGHAPGEEVLQKFQMSREESLRLRDIEERLQVMQEVKKREGGILM